MSEIERAIGRGRAPALFRRLTRRSASLLVGAVGLALWLLFPWTDDSAGKYRTAAVRRGDLHLEISATGTVEPEELVDIGAQVAGQIVSLGTDLDGRLVDYGSRVDEGEVLARIDESLYRSDVAEAEAQLGRAKAELVQLQAKLVQAERDWKRAQKLGASDALARSAFDAFEASYEVAKANIAVGEAAIVQAQAGLQRAERNLGYTVIRSPVNGVVIDRRINVGQTVVSSLNAPSLFLIAKDLSRMEVWVSVNEADIGNIRIGQPVTFTVDAFPLETFRGTVQKVRLNATMTQNVVTYIVEVAAENPDGRLLPYLTANVRFEVSKRENALLVPNAALRFTPSDARDNGTERPKAASEQSQRIWIADGDRPKAIAITHLGSDGVHTAVEAPDLEEGMLVIVGEEVSARGNTPAGTNPFTPQMPRGARRS